MLKKCPKCSTGSKKYWKLNQAEGKARCLKSGYLWISNKQLQDKLNLES